MPRLRLDLDFLPSPDPERPGLMLRDPCGYSDRVLLLPPLLAQALGFLDGERSELDLRHFLVSATGDIRAGAAAVDLITALDEAGFLDNERFAKLREQRQREFAELPVRPPTHLGPGGYPGDPQELKAVFSQYFESAQTTARSTTIGIAAPHVSPFGGWKSYADAYAAIPEEAAEKIFVVLGTSHYGAPERFGLTRKPYATPYGVTRNAPDFVDELAAAAPDAVVMEDYCHAREHSIEFQVVFLQHRFGPQIRVLPILCGPFARSIYEGGRPEDDPRVARFLGALGEIAARRGHELFWILGVDLAHMGRRYGDPAAMSPYTGEMAAVERRDWKRLRAIETGRVDEYWGDVQLDRDRLKWCGSAPLYTFLRVMPQLCGETHRYEQWPIDEGSVVSFAAISFALKP